MKDRWEGVEASRPVSSGANLTIISLIRETSWKVPDLTENIALKYIIPEDGDYQVSVHAPDRRYKMLQSMSYNDRYVNLKSGPTTFVWNARIIKLLHSDSSELFCLINRRAGDGKLVPAILAPAPVSNSVIPGDYAVCVVPNTDAIELKLSVKNSDQAAYSTVVRNAPRHRPLKLIVPSAKLERGICKLSFEVKFANSAQLYRLEKSFDHVVSR